MYYVLAPPLPFLRFFSCLLPSLFAINSEQKRPLAINLNFVRLLYYVLLIKDRQENPFSIIRQDHGHSACYTKCPKFPQPKKGTPFADPKKKRNFATKWIKEGISFTNVVSGEVPNQTPIENKKEDPPRGFPR
ncbi:hypothetical protein TNCV_4130661 [Trichonephila clavipes]|nr:hypothetical protein TNCV_4130661 [Trichonephila clavipes]